MPENAGACLQAGAKALGVGSPLVDAARLAARDWRWLAARIARFKESCARPERG
jgi:2-keto-3-deoxy-6-phosphogluconate aldolase